MMSIIFLVWDYVCVDRDYPRISNPIRPVVVFSLLFDSPHACILHTVTVYLIHPDAHVYMCTLYFVHTVYK